MTLVSSVEHNSLLRLADVYLVYAEAILGNNGSTADGEALQYFNAVRKRAGVDPAPSLNIDTLIQERRRWLSQHAASYSELCRAIGERSPAGIRYESGVGATDEPHAALRELLEQRRASDIRRGATHTGPHRDTLAQMKSSGGADPRQGYKLEYRNSKTGAAVLPTIGAWLQLLPAGYRDPGPLAQSIPGVLAGGSYPSRWTTPDSGLRVPDSGSPGLNSGLWTAGAGFPTMARTPAVGRPRAEMRLRPRRGS
jgi:hypothetical protein